MPRLALRVGITGHRWRDSHHGEHERLAHAQSAAVQATMRRVLQRIREQALAVHAQQTALFARTAPLLSLVSALAEGADELAAMVAVEPDSGYVLDLVVPYDLATYAARCAPGTPTRALWDAARARLVLDGVAMADESTAGSGQARHEATLIETNRRLVWNCDLIIAVWDELPARGEAGTARVIERARAEGLPVVHINSITPDRVRVLDAAGATRIERDEWIAIDEIVARLLDPPEPSHRSQLASAHGPPVQHELLRALHTYVRESPPSVIVRHVATRVYQVTQFLLTGNGSLRALEPNPERLPVPWQPVVTAPAMSARRAQIIDPAFRRADYYATAYGARHRSTFTTILVFAPFAVVCAWLGNLALEELKLPYATGELLLLSVLTIFFVRSQRLRFHAKWLDYRLLAERLRHLGFLWPLGRSSPVIRVPTHAVFTDPRPAWVNWWYRAVAREAGVADVELDQPTVRALAEQIEQRLLAAQLAYNQHAHRVAHRAEHGLHLMPWLPLSAALVAAMAHVLEYLHVVHLEPSSARVLTGIGIIGPAFGAALHSFASQAGFQEVGIRTDASAQQLERFREQLDRIDLAAPLASCALGDLALSVADVMGEDLAGWRVDYLSRPVNPPG